MAAGGIECAKLNGAINELQLVEFGPKLSELGVKLASDVLLLEDRDLGSIGLNKVQMRKLQRACQNDEEDNDSDGYDASKPTGKPKVPQRPTLERSLSSSKRKQSAFWRNQLGRPMRLIFIRHGESEANVDRDITSKVPDHCLHLTEKGRQQALDAGRRLKSLLGDETVQFIVSPYVRTRETFNGIKHAWGDTPVKMKTDVRIREQEFGNYDQWNMKALHKEKKAFGPFYFRFPDGESPADCYDRASSFLETMYRSWQDNADDNHVVVGHGMMILMLLMRLMRYSIAQWEAFDSLSNCELVVLERPPDDGKYQVAYTWQGGGEPDPNGLRKKPAGTVIPDDIEIWDGDPDALPLTSAPRRIMTPQV